MARIFLSPPHMSARERELLLQAFDSGWIAPLGPQVDAFEAELAARAGVPHALALASGTAALHLGLLVLGVQPGDSVICASFTFAASANVIRYVGAEPVFVDADEATWCIDPDAVAEAIASERAAGRRVGAVIAVDLYGSMPDYERLEALCQALEVPLLEDAAEALGSTLGGRPAGSFGDAGVFSFNGNKIMTTSGGGMFVSRQAEPVRKARYLSTQAREPVAHYEHRAIGFNYRLSNLLAAVGRGQLERLDELLALRARNRTTYERELSDVLAFMPIPEGLDCNHWLTCGLLTSHEPEQVRLALEAHDIEARRLWKPMHLQPVFQECRRVGGAVCEHLFDRGLCLPSGSVMTEDDLERVVSAVRGATA